jgi:xanthine dehydrogenase YagS FAD-binding subunit
MALEAAMVIRRAGGGERVVPAEQYFVGPGIDITRMTVLRPGELLTAVRIPATWANATFYFEKVRDRQVWDFPLVNVASALKLSAASGGTIEAVRVAVGAVAATPVRLTAVEQAVTGKPRNNETAQLAGELAVEGAQPLRYNGYKVPLMRNLVTRAIRGTSAATTT